MMRKAETGASVDVIELPGDRQPPPADLLAPSFQVNPNFVDLFPDGKVRARALVHVRKRAYATPSASGTSTRRYVTGGSSRSQPGCRQAASRSRWGDSCGSRPT
jgi:hypothetical protein